MKTIIAFCGATIILTALWGMTAVLAASPAEPGVFAGAPDRVPTAITDNRQWFPLDGRLTTRGGFDPEPATRFEAKLHGTWDTRTGRRIQPLPPYSPAGDRPEIDTRAD